ncbi:GyrI-like domain-containing protein [Streptosporangiaceae bacterium NEAU-GS5]|nr:GyrI-like domain-containing protein [Streptosporangiaceae bacterium NEAU-GS5]
MTVMTVPERPTAVLTATTTWADYPRVWKQLLGEVQAGVEWPAGGRQGRIVMLYLDDWPSVEVGVELDRPAKVGEGIVRSVLPAGRVAVTVHRGPYEKLGETYEILLCWCAEQGLKVTRTRWEVYGHWHEDPAQLETELYWLLAE